MKITLKCGCKGSLNKQKKVFTFYSLCDKHLNQLVRRMERVMWYGSDAIDFPEHPTSNAKFWLDWLDQTRRKALKIP